jgi:hypothetical protein
MEPGLCERLSRDTTKNRRRCGKKAGLPPISAEKGFGLPGFGRAGGCPKGGGRRAKMRVDRRKNQGVVGKDS